MENRVFFALAFVFFGIVLGALWVVPTYAFVQEEIHEHVHEAEKKEAGEPGESVIEERRTADYTKDLDWWTAGLVAVAFGQAIMFAIQLAFMRRGMADTKNAADSAASSARTAERALTELEAPSVFIEFKRVGVTIAYQLDPNPEQPTSSFCAGEVIYRFVNYGRMPARILGLVDCLETIEIGDGDPHPLNVMSRPQLPWGLVVPPNGKRSSEYTYAVNDREFSDESGTRFEPDDANVFFSVVLRYSDGLGGIYRMGACFILTDKDGSLPTWMLSSYGHPRNYLLREDDADET